MLQVSGRYLIAAMLVAGCTPQASRPHIKGRVIFKGEPVGGQTLTLYSEGTAGEFFTHKIPLRADGTFSGEVSAPGNYTVVIEESLAAQEGRQAGGEKRMAIPPKYRKATTSGYVWPIHKGDNSREITLEE
jgi:hypothetical protein